MALHTPASPPVELRDNPLVSGKVTVGLLTAQRPKFKVLVPGENKALEQQLHARGFQFVKAPGAYDGPEESYMVIGPTREQMFDLGKKFGQEAVVFSKGGQHEMLYTNGPNEGKFHPSLPQFEYWPHTDEPPENYYTTMPEGGHIRLHFDWDTLKDAPQNFASKAPSSPQEQPDPVGEGGSSLGKSQRVLGALKKSLGMMQVRHPHAYPWHDHHTGHHPKATVPGGVAISSKQELVKDEPGAHAGKAAGHMHETGSFQPDKPVAHPHTDGAIPGKNDQAAGAGVPTYAKFASAYGTIDKTQPSNLAHYDYTGKGEAVSKLLADHGFQHYYAGGRYGKPDLANRNYNTGHLMVYDPTPQSGGDFGDFETTDNWRKVHELAHALVYPELNRIYGEGRRIGRLGKHRTMREAQRAVHWEWLAAHKQRELSKQLGVEIPDETFNREVNTVMHDALHRAVTGKFTEPSEEGFKPHAHLVPLEHALGQIATEARNLGLQGPHDLMIKAETTTKSPVTLDDIRLGVAGALKKAVKDYEDHLLDLRSRETTALAEGKQRKNASQVHPTALINVRPMRKDEAMGYGSPTPQTNQLAGTSSGSGMALAEAPYTGPERRTSVTVQRGTGERISLPARHLARIQASRPQAASQIKVTTPTGQVLHVGTDQLHELAPPRKTPTIFQRLGLGKGELTKSAFASVTDKRATAGEHVKPLDAPTTPPPKSAFASVTDKRASAQPPAPPPPALGAPAPLSPHDPRLRGMVSTITGKPYEPPEEPLPGPGMADEDVPNLRSGPGLLARFTAAWRGAKQGFSMGKAEHQLQALLPSLAGSLNAQGEQALGKALAKAGFITSMHQKARGTLAAARLMSSVATTPIVTPQDPATMFSHAVPRPSRATTRSPIMSKSLNKAGPANMGAKPPSGGTPGAPKMPKPATPKVGGAPAGGAPTPGAPKVAAPKLPAPKAPAMPKPTVPATGVPPKPQMGKAELGGKVTLTPERAAQYVASKHGQLQPHEHLARAKHHMAQFNATGDHNHLHVANAHGLHAIGMGKGEAGSLSGSGTHMNAPMALSEADMAKTAPPGFSEETMHKLKAQQKAKGQDEASAFKIAWAQHNKTVKKAENEPTDEQIEGMIKPSDEGKKDLPGKKDVKDVTPDKHGSGGEEKKLGKAALPAAAPSRLSQMHAAYKGAAPAAPPAPTGLGLHKAAWDPKHQELHDQVLNTMGFGHAQPGPAKPQAWDRRGGARLGPGDQITMTSVAGGKPSAPVPHNPSLPFGGQPFTLQSVAAKPAGMPQATSPASQAAMTQATPRTGLLDRFKAAHKGGTAAGQPLVRSELAKSTLDKLQGVSGRALDDEGDRQAVKVHLVKEHGLSAEHAHKIVHGHQSLSLDDEGDRKKLASAIDSHKAGMKKAESEEKYDGPTTAPACKDCGGKTEFHRFNAGHYEYQCKGRECGKMNKIPRKGFKKSEPVEQLQALVKSAKGELETMKKNGELCKRCQSEPIHKNSLCKGCGEHKAMRKREGNEQ